MDINAVRAIDVHAHFGCYEMRSSYHRKFCSAGINEVKRRMTLSNTQLSIVSPLEAFMPQRGSPLKANAYAAKIVSKECSFLQWVVVDPRRPATFAQAERILVDLRCAGIKIHPVLHRYSISRYGRKIFEFAANHGAIVQSHSGEHGCLPRDFIQFANAFPGVRIIVSHLGCGYNGDITLQVRAIQKAKHGNLFTDTSSATSITPNLIEWAVKEIGPEKILFGTDSPLYFSPMQRVRINNADITDRAKLMILRENALNLFGEKLKRLGILKKDNLL